MNRRIIGVTVGTPISPKAIERKLQISDMKEQLETLKQDVDDILAEIHYQNIDITAFSCPGAGTYEIGTFVPAPNITWTLNKEPASQTINGEALDVTDRSKKYTGSITSTNSYKLTVTGQKGEKAEKTGTFTFLNGVYYGVCNDGDDVEDIMAGLSKKLQNSRGLTFTANAGSGQQHAFAMPNRSPYGTPTFTDAETKLSAGMYLAVENFDFTNSSGYTEKYNLWLSSRTGLGEMTIVVG